MSFGRIIEYDMSVYTKVGGHNWESKDWYKSDYYYARLEKIRKKKHKGTAREGTSEYYRRLSNSIDRVHKRLIRENITDKKEEGWTFGIESVKRKAKTYHYFCRQRRVKGTENKHERKYLDAKDEDDYINRVLRNQARIQVLNDLAGGWTREGLTRSENETFDIIIKEFRTKKNERTPIIAEYIKQLGLKINSKKHGFISIKRMSLQKKKNILIAARKQFKRRFTSRDIVAKSNIGSGGYFTLDRTRKLGQAKTAVQPIILID